MAYTGDTAFGEVRFFDDFLDDTIDTFVYDIDTDRTAWAIATSAAGGAITCAGTTNGDVEKIAGACNWRPSTMGTIVFEARVKLDTSVTQGCFIGLSDDNTTDEVPINLDTGTYTTTATDAVGFVYDSQEGTNWYIGSVAANVDGTQTATGVVPTADVYQTLRSVLESNGNARFFIDGKEITVSGAARSACVTSTVYLCPIAAHLNSGTASGLTMDYWYVSGGRVAAS